MSPFLSCFLFISFKITSLEYFVGQTFFASLSYSYSVRICSFIRFYFYLKCNYLNFYMIVIFVHFIHLAYNSKRLIFIKCHFAYLHLWIHTVWNCIWIGYYEVVNLSPIKFSSYHYFKLIKGIYFLNEHFYLLLD